LVWVEATLTDPVAAAINQLNQWSQPVLSIDLPSGLHTDTGEVLGTARRVHFAWGYGSWAFCKTKRWIMSAHLID